VRTTALIALFLVLAGAYCGGQKPGTQAQKTETTAQLPAEASGLLTEGELAKMVKAMPVVAEAMKTANYQAQAPAPEDQVAVVFAKLIDGMKAVPGLDSALAASGTNWQEFRATMYKVFAASAAIGVDMAGAMSEELAKDTTAQAKKMLKQMNEAKAVLAKVPAENKQMVMSHQSELEGLQSLTR